MNWKPYYDGYMASNVINRWFINYKPSIILEATTLAIMYLVLTSDHLFVSWHRYQVGCEEFHTRKQSNHAVSHENKTMGI